MSFENTPNEQEQKEKLFEELWEDCPKDGSFIEYTAPYPKHDFLEYLVRTKGVLLHGSGWDGEELEPRQGHCISKKFGRQKAVYAVQDEITPIFFATIKDREGFRGRSKSGRYGNRKNGNARYQFAVEKEALEQKPWSDGVIYLLPRDSFEQGVNDDGNLIDEFASTEPVRPLAKLRVSPEDFPYLDKIEILP